MATWVWIESILCRFAIWIFLTFLQELQSFMQESDMVLLNITQVENLEVKLLHTLSNKVRITSPDRSKRRSVSAQRVKHDELESNTRKVLRFHESSPPHHYEIIASPSPMAITSSVMSSSTMQRLKKRLKRSESVGTTKSIIKTTQYQKPDFERLSGKCWNMLQCEKSENGHFQNWQNSKFEKFWRSKISIKMNFLVP